MAMKKYRSVEHYFEALEIWQPELTRLRTILLDCDMEETLKWSIPTYTYKNKNVVGISGFKSYFGLWFYQGALLEDNANVLINAQEGKTQAMRQWRMTSKSEIKVRMIKAYVKESLANIDAGKEIKPDRTKPLVIHPLLKSALANSKKAKANFDKMSLSCRREYADYINDAKREETKVRRLAKIIPMIEENAGLSDKYR